MSDSKRNSVAGKVATPKSGLQQGAPDMDTLNKAIGSRIRITTTSPTLTIEGTIFTADSTLVALKEDVQPAPPNPASTTSSAGNPSYRIIPLSNIASYTISGGGDPEVLDLVKQLDGYVMDKEAMRKKEVNAVKKMREWEASRGKGVSQEAQDLFDHIARTLPAFWNKDSIVVNESVIVEPPYTSAHCKAPVDKAAALPQVKKVVEGFWAKRKSQGQGAKAGANVQAAGNGRATPALPVVRKGG